MGEVEDWTKASIFQKSKNQINYDSVYDRRRWLLQKSSIITSPPPIFAPASWEVTESASVRFAFRALLVLIDERKSGSSFASSTSSSFLFVCLLNLDFFFFYFGEA